MPARTLGFPPAADDDILTAAAVPALTALPALSVGLDLVQVARIADSLARFGARFAERVFTADEIAHCEAATGSERVRRYAARFAAKEAAWKALGLDDRGHSWRAVEVVRDARGSCAIALHEPLARRAFAVGARALSLSITHEADYAAAVVLAAHEPSP
jgi:holo-[acyl-carrier protein] synthase